MCASDDNPFGTAWWRFAADTNDPGVPITLLEAPSLNPTAATSAETSRLTHTPGMQGLNVPVGDWQLPVPYQNFDAARELPGRRLREVRQWASARPRWAG